MYSRLEQSWDRKFHFAVKSYLELHFFLYPEFSILLNLIACAIAICANQRYNNKYIKKGLQYKALYVRAMVVLEWLGRKFCNMKFRVRNRNERSTDRCWKLALCNKRIFNSHYYKCYCIQSFKFVLYINKHLLIGIDNSIFWHIIIPNYEFLNLF